LCQIGEQHLGSVVNCGRCGKPFSVRAPAPVAAVVQVAPVVTPPLQSAPRPTAAPPGTYDPVPAGGPTMPINLKEGLKGVLRALVPFSKVDDGSQIPSFSMPSASSPAAAPASSGDEEFNFDFAPAAEAALRKETPAPQPVPVPAPGPSGRATWQALPGTGVCRLDIGGATSPGMVRKRNEDSFLIQQLCWSNLDKRRELALVVLADGLGGHDAGDRASHMVIQGVGAGLASLLGNALSGQQKDFSPQTLSQAIELAIKGANQAIHRRAQTEQGCKGMGATAAVVLICDGQVMIGHVGDCRVYGYRAGKINQLTRDQTLVERMVQLGQLTPQQAAVHPARNEVAQAVGRQSDIEPAAYQLKLVPGDWLIVACDGLHAHVDAALLEKTVREAVPSATQLAHQLVSMTDQRGGSDNCTVVAVRCY
jgi:serine/threonine protein phosphatase PrpC